MITSQNAEENTPSNGSPALCVILRRGHKAHESGSMLQSQFAHASSLDRLELSRKMRVSQRILNMTRYLLLGIAHELRNEVAEELTLI